MHKKYEYPFTLQWFNHKHNSQEHKTFEQRFECQHLDVLSTKS